jgi:hypothetical protein
MATKELKVPLDLMDQMESKDFKEKQDQLDLLGQ